MDMYICKCGDVSVGAYTVVSGYTTTVANDKESRLFKPA